MTRPYTLEDVRAVEAALEAHGIDPEPAKDILDAVAPQLLGRHLEALAVQHETYAARTDQRVPPASKSTARIFARWLRRHSATLSSGLNRMEAAA